MRKHRITLTDIHECEMYIAEPDQWIRCFLQPNILIFFLMLHEKICCGYSFEGPLRGASNEYPQHMFLWRSEKEINIFLISHKLYPAGIILA